MAIPNSDYKLLWGRAAGYCSNPGCHEDLTVMLEKGRGYNIGEMAHIIAKSVDGPRGQLSEPNNSYENLILLCPTCHKKIDKAPEEYSVAELQEWKAKHENEIRSRGIDKKFESLELLKRAVAELLLENRAIWTSLGPNSEAALSDPGSNLHLVWKLRKLDRIIPNNRLIVNMIEANRGVLSAGDLEAFVLFKVHAGAFEQHQYDRLDRYPEFPAIFGERFCT